MHFQISGHRKIPGGYQTFSGSGWGNTAAQAIADAMKRNPELAAWKVWELSATPERPLTVTRQEALASLTNGSVDLDNGQKPNGHGATAGANPAAGSFFPTVSCLLAVLVVFAGNFEANGGDSISAGFSADGQATRAGAGMVAAPTRTGFESLLHKTAGPADSLLSGHRKAPVARTETRQSGFIPNSASDTLRGDSAQVGNDATTTSRVSVRPAQKFYPSPSPSRDDASRLAFVESHAGGRETVRWQRNPDVWAGVAGDAGGRIGRPHFLSPSPEVFHDRVGLSADLPSVGSTRGVGNFFDRDTKAALLTLAVAAVVLVRSGFCLDRNDREESARRVREMEGRL